MPKKSLVKSIFISSLFLILSFPAFAAPKDGPFNWPVSTWTNLNVGIYWVAPGNIYCPANGNTQTADKKDQKTQKNPVCAQAFDPKKPTMIFLHGWEPGSTRLLSRFDFYDPVSGLDKKYADLAKSWREKGWNVGVFYWNQISDTIPYPSEAAAKIWTTKSSQSMYWKQYNPKAEWSYNKVVDRNACKNPKSPQCISVGEMAYNDYVKAMKNYQGNRIRIVGHSLGGQLAVYLTHKIATQVAAGKISPELLPQQLVLLDPYISVDNSYLSAVGINNYNLFNQYVKDIAYKYGIVVSEYLSSDLTLPDEWSPAEDVAAVTYYRPWFDSFWREDQKHSDSWFMYFQSMKDAPPKTYIKYNVINGNGKPLPTKIPGMSAATPIFAKNTQNTKNTQIININNNNNNNNDNTLPVYGIAAMMGEANYWDQKCGENGKLCGQYSPNTDKDGFLEKINGNNWSNPRQIIVKNDGSPIQKGTVLNMPLGSMMHLEAELYPKNTQNQIVLWQSSNPKIVRVYPGGYIKALQAGNVEITAISPYIVDGNTGSANMSFQVSVNNNGGIMPINTKANNINPSVSLIK